MTKICVLTSDNSRQVTNWLGLNVLSSTRRLVSATAPGRIGTLAWRQSQDGLCSNDLRLCARSITDMQSERERERHTLRHNSLITPGTQGNEQGKCTHIRPVITKKMLANWRWRYIYDSEGVFSNAIWLYNENSYSTFNNSSTRRNKNHKSDANVRAVLSTPKPSFVTAHSW